MRVGWARSGREVGLVTIGSRVLSLIVMVLGFRRDLFLLEISKGLLFRASLVVEVEIWEVMIYASS